MLPMRRSKTGPLRPGHGLSWASGMPLPPAVLLLPLLLQVFCEVSPLVTSVLDGYNVCIMAYGQTGSGKTWTMEGPEENPGVNSRALAELFKVAEVRLKQKGQEGVGGSRENGCENGQTNRWVWGSEIRGVGGM